MTEVRTERKPRPILDDPADVLKLIESNPPPEALAHGEILMIVGRPPQNLETGEGYVPSWGGMLSYRYHGHLEYRRADRRVLRYEYEGLLAYVLVEAGER